MKKNGHTAAGAQRWKCTSCALSTTCPSGRARRHEQADELADFIAWATSRHTQDEQEGSARAFRRRTCWCWQVPVPHPPVTGQVHDQIFIDGMHLSGGWVLLIARDREHVLEWQWAANESAQAYTALLERLAPADVVRACQFFCVWGLEVGGDSVGVGGGEPREGLFPVGGGVSLDEAGVSCSFVGGFASVCEALGGAFVFDVADGEP